MLLENAQIIKEDNQPKFAVIPFADYLELKSFLADPDRLADYMDYLHMQRVKAQNPARLSLTEVKAALEAEEGEETPSFFNASYVTRPLPASLDRYIRPLRIRRKTGPDASHSLRKAPAFGGFLFYQINFINLSTRA